MSSCRICQSTERPLSLLCESGTCGSDQKICIDCFRQFLESELEVLNNGGDHPIKFFTERKGKIRCPLHVTGCGGSLHMEFLSQVPPRTRKSLCVLVEKLERVSSVNDNGVESRKDLEKVLRLTLFGAKQCPYCKFGPVLHDGCGDLTTHHLQCSRQGGITNNKCPNCGSFSEKEWPDWDGKLYDPDYRPCCFRMRQLCCNLFKCCDWFWRCDNCCWYCDDSD